MKMILKHCLLLSLAILVQGRNYFIVDRTKIVQDLVRYEIQASQSPIAVEGMACEDPFVYGYSVLDSTGTPRFTDTYYKNNLNFIESDSISKLPGAVEESDYYEVHSMKSSPRLINGVINSRVFALK